MRKLFPAVLTATILVLTLVAAVPTAQAQGQCEPISGMIYAWYTDSWHGVMTVTVGRTTRQATLHAAGTSFVDNGDIWRGTEKWTIDFGNGDTLLAKTHFICEHMTDAVSASKVYHVTEGGQITGGAGAFAKAYGNLMAQGPFGENVKLPRSIQTPANAQAYWMNPVQGLICRD